ncbi:hypothetical protein ACFW05_13125, partial [Streptomyces albogriseolus]
MAIVFVLVALLVVAVLVTGNWYVWRRLFRDTTAGPGPVRRIGAAVIAGGWLLFIGSMVASRVEAPFTLQRVLAWPGSLWLALTLYLVLALLVGELVRPVLRRLLGRRAAKPAPAPAPAHDLIPAGRPEGPEATVAESDATTTPDPAESGAAAADPAAGGSTAAGAAGAGAGPSRRLFVSRVVGGAAGGGAGGGGGGRGGPPFTPTPPPPSTGGGWSRWAPVWGNGGPTTRISPRCASGWVR